MNPEKLAALLMDGHLWLVVLASFGLGMTGALLNSDVSYSPEVPSQPAQNGWSKILDLLAGGIAAVAVLYVSNPETGIALISGSLVGGYGGKAVLAALRARLVSAVARTEARAAVLDAEKAQAEARIAHVDRIRTQRDLDLLVANIEKLDMSSRGQVTVSDLLRLGKEVQSKRASEAGGDQ